MVGHHFITVTWGTLFTDLLLKVLLPNQLTPGNLGYFRGKPGCRYKVYTTADDARRIAAAPIFVKLQAIMPVDLIVVTGLGQRSGFQAAYDDMTWCHKSAIVAGERDGAAMLFLPGDAIWSEGSFRRLADLVDAGFAAVLVPGIRLVLESYVDCFIERFYDAASIQAKAQARDLAAHALPHLHPLTRACFLDSPRFIQYPSHMIVPVEGQGFLLKGFHMHPAIIKPMVTGGDVEMTIDHDYLDRACPDPSRIHVVEDSDEILQVAVDREDHRADLLRPNRFNLSKVAAFARKQANSFQRDLCIDRVYRMHADDIGPEWLEAERRIAGLTDRLRFLMRP